MSEKLALIKTNLRRYLTPFTFFTPCFILVCVYEAKTEPYEEIDRLPYLRALSNLVCRKTYKQAKLNTVRKKI